MSNIFQWIINSSLIINIRRNHALEHATLQILSRKYPERTIAGYSYHNGICIFGNIPKEDITDAVEEAYNRLKNGESYLAVHPHCGTNFVVSGLLTGVSSALMMIGMGPRLSDRVNRIGLAAFVGTIVLILSQPTGPFIQSKITTSSDLGSMQIIGYQTTKQNNFTINKVFIKN